ncbi:MAG TPA: M3 family oligoendopeptidase [Anaerolineales bacterium]|nr:M3 family oligoendopeptidase [Anaerolineales bacterium]
MTSTTYEQTRWQLDDLFRGKDSEEMKTHFEALETAVHTFEERRGELTADISPEVLLDFVAQLEHIYRLAYRVYGFAALWFSENTQNQDAQTFIGKVQQIFAQLQNRILFFSLWWKDVDDKNAERLLKETGVYAYYLREMRNFKPYTLTEPEEKILNIKNVTGVNALTTLYETITNRFQFEFEVDGQKQTLTRDALMSYAYSTDPQIRERAFKTMYETFKKEGSILGQIYQYIVRDWHNENVDLRKFASPISVRNLANDIPDEVIDTLLDVAKQNVTVFQRYFQLKAKWLGMERIRRFDLYAPVTKTDKAYSYNDGIGMVLDAFSEFTPEFATLAQQVFDSHHIDSEVRMGKDDGAFCFGVLPELTPWVLVNYHNQPRDVATLAHELGHAIHAMLAAKNPLLTVSPSLPLAETASTFGEMVLVDYLLAREEDQNVRTDMLFRQVDNAYATIMRQIFFALFEREAHTMIQQGASVDELAEAYFKNLQTQFGDSMELDDDFRWEWVAIPHIYKTPFYVYAYAFGLLLVLSLYQQYKAEGESFKPRYLKILAAGGSAAPAEILAEAGVDIHSAAFWQGGFDVLSRLVDDLEKIPR